MPPVSRRNKLGGKPALVVTEEERQQKLKERIEDAEVAEYSRTGVDKRILRCAAVFSSCGIMIKGLLLTDVIDLDSEPSVVGDGGVARDQPPATTRMIERLRDMTVTQEHMDVEPQCSICADDFILGDILHVLPGCQHFYHKVCVRKWLAERWTCPVCRTPLRFCRLGKVRRAERKEEAEQSTASTEDQPSKAVIVSNLSNQPISSAYDEPIQVCVLAYVERLRGRRPPFGHAPQPVETTHRTSPDSESFFTTYRHSRTANLEIVRLVFTVPKSVHRIILHANIPASAETVCLQMFVSAYFKDVNITASVQKYNISETDDIAEMEFYEGGREVDIIANIPSSPEDDGVREIGGERVARARDVNIQVNTASTNVPTALLFQEPWKPTDLIPRLH